MNNWIVEFKKGYMYYTHFHNSKNIDPKEINFSSITFFSGNNNFFLKAELDRIKCACGKKLSDQMKILILLAYKDTVYE